MKVWNVGIIFSSELLNLLIYILTLRCSIINLHSQESSRIRHVAMAPTQTRFQCKYGLATHGIRQGSSKDHPASYAYEPDVEMFHHQPPQPRVIQVQTRSYGCNADKIPMQIWSGYPWDPPRVRRGSSRFIRVWSWRRDGSPCFRWAMNATKGHPASDAYVGVKMVPIPYGLTSYWS